MTNNTYNIYRNFDKLQNIHNNNNNNIFAFDLDNTLIKFNLNSDKYVFLYDENIIMNRLKKISKTHNIIIISNQKHNKYELFEKKISSLLEYLKNKININISVYVSIKNDEYRKPNVGLKNIIEKDYKSEIEYYCGDALGRLDKLAEKGDFSDTDYKFALNLGIKIISPEEVFLNKKTESKNIIYPQLNSIKYDFGYIPEKNEMIIMTGYPASGKSYISNKIQEIGFINNIYYKIINRDTLKTIDKCIKETKNSLEYRINIIIDNTNPSREDRKKFIDIAKKYNYKVIVIKMLTSKDESMHNNYYRTFKYKKQFIPEIAYNIYKSKYQEPKLTENIDKIIETGCELSIDNSKREKEFLNSFPRN
jgi:bifunctional polynucleotide phosphatase/kinase